MGAGTSGVPTAALLNLNGTQTDIVGKVSETDFFSFLNLPKEVMEKLDKSMSPEQALKFRGHVARMKIGISAAIPMICAGGIKCPNKQCPLNESKLWPLAESCPVESILIAEWTKGYIDDLTIDPNCRTEMVLINKLVECDIIDYRANIGFATQEDAWTLLKVDTVSDGERTTEMTNVHPLIEIKEKVHRIRDRVLESLAATRKERYKRAAALKQRENESIGDYMANLKQAIQAAKAKNVTNISLEDLKKDVQDEQVIDTTTEF